ncbi:hypothetical protein CR513_28133, partial [Mucuna pruriens]
MHMEDLEKMFEYFTQILSLTNLIIECGEKLSMTKKGVGDKSKWKKGKIKFTKHGWYSNEERSKFIVTDECWFSKGKQKRCSNDEAHMTQEDSNFDLVLLMETTRYWNIECKSWKDYDQRRNGKTTLIKNVLYVSKIKYNILSIG